jgi:hypothetical protein
MPGFRGLHARLCPSCKEIAAHKTLYVKTESRGKSKWIRIFWVCMACNSLNHVILPTYSLESVPPELPSSLVTCAVEALKQGPKTIDELVQELRGTCPGVGHIFTSEVRLAMEYLKGRGTVTEEAKDLTELTVAELRSRPASSNHLRRCPAEAGRGVVTKGLVAVYAQHRLNAGSGDEASRTGKLRFTPIGALCVSCGYHRVDPALVGRRRQAPRRLNLGVHM